MIPSPGSKALLALPSEQIQNPGTPTAPRHAPLLIPPHAWQWWCASQARLTKAVPRGTRPVAPTSFTVNLTSS